MENEQENLSAAEAIPKKAEFTDPFADAEPSKKSKVWVSVVETVKKVYAKLTIFLDTYANRIEVKKAFDAQCAVFVDLSDGKRIKGMKEGAEVKFPADTKLDPLHRYYCNGAIYRLDDGKKETLFDFGIESNPEQIRCYAAPYENIVTPIANIEKSLDDYERIVKNYEPNFLEIHKQTQTDVIKLFVDFRKAVAAKRRDVELFDTMVSKSAVFAPKAAQIIAAIVSGIR